MDVLGKSIKILVYFLFLVLIPSIHAEEALVIDSDYTFSEDIIVLSGHGIVIAADNITIDGNGFFLDGTAPGLCEGGIIDHVGIYNLGFDNVVIKNLEIKNFSSGIFISYDSSNGNIVYNNIIDNCIVHHNGNDNVEWTESHGIKMIGVSDSIIKNCFIYNNKGVGNGCEDGGNGIFIKGTSSGDGGKRNRVTNNEIYNNSKGGFFTKMKPEYTIVDNNTIYGNGQGGIILRCMLSNTHTIENNTLYENYGSGIFIGGNDNVIRNNVISSNKNGSKYTGDVGRYGTGVKFGRNDGSKNNSLFNNIICGNDMIDVEAFDTNENTGNQGRGNTGDTAINYKDDEVKGSGFFTYSCFKETVKSEPTANSYENTDTPGFESLILFSAIAVLCLLKTRKNIGEKNL